MCSQARLVWTVLGACVLFGAAGCGGGGSGGHSALVASGNVLSPNGQVIALQGPATGHSMHALDLTGLLPVPDGTPVELVRLDANGSTLDVLASTTTTGGRYSFNLNSLHLAFASDLAVAAGSGASRMRAPVVEKSVDVDPLSEAVVQLILQQGAPLDAFTVDEIRDLVTATRLLAAANSLAADVDVASTVNLIQQAVLGESTLAGFLAAASAAGQTSEGPGDVGEYFPLNVGDGERFEGSSSTDGAPEIAFVSTRRVAALDPRGVFTVEENDPDTGPTTVNEFLEKTSLGIVARGTDDPEDELSQAVQPFLEVRFPPHAGDERELFDVGDIPLRFDLDGDSISDSFGVHAVQTTIGFESVTVPAGMFDQSAHLRTRIVTTFHLSTGTHATSTSEENDWFAPHIGLVRSTSDTTTFVAGEQFHDTSHQDLVGYQIGHNGHGIPPSFPAAVGLCTADSGEGRPGRPAVAFSGTNYLLVTRREIDPPTRLVGVLLSPTGVAIDEFTIANDGLAPSVSFDGDNYLVVFATNGGAIAGVRVSPDGTVLDAAPFTISTTGFSNYGPAVAFDGARSLVVWGKFTGGPAAYDIYASFVTPAGKAVREIAVYAAEFDQLLPDVVFANGNYTVVFQDDSSGTPDARGVRVTTSGVILDPSSFDVATESEPEESPQIASDGTGLLVVWSRPPLPSLFGFHVYGARLEADGTQSDAAPFPISTGSGFCAFPDVSFDGTNYFVAWGYAAFQPPWGIHGMRITPRGELLDGSASSNGITITEPPDPYTRLLYPVFAVGKGSSTLMWLVNRELAGTTKSIEGTVIYPF